MNIQSHLEQDGDQTPLKQNVITIHAQKHPSRIPKITSVILSLIVIALVGIIMTRKEQKVQKSILRATRKIFHEQMKICGMIKDLSTFESISSNELNKYYELILSVDEITSRMESKLRSFDLNQVSLSSYAQIQSIISECDRTISLNIDTQYDDQFNQTKHEDPVMIPVEHTQQRKMELIIIKNKGAQNENCAMVNGINILSPHSLDSVSILFEHKVISKGIFIVDSLDKVSKDMLQIFKKRYGQFQNKIIQTDSDYHFALQATEKCGKVMFLQNNFVLQKTKQMKTLFDSLSEFQMLFSQKARIGSNVKDLPDLTKIDLHQMTNQKIGEFLFIFHTSLLNYITPLNFAFYNRFTVEEMILFPIVALLQKSNKLKMFNQTLHAFDEGFPQFKDFKLKPPNYESNNSLCFVSYPSNPFNSSKLQFEKYFDSISNFTDKKISIVVYLPYSIDASPIWDTIEKLIMNSKSFLRVKIRIRGNKTVSSLSVYESAYTYCPNRSILISSRHNIEFVPLFSTYVKGALAERYHYYTINFKNQSNVKVNAATFSRRQVAKLRKYGKSWNVLQHVQIFKSDLFKMMFMWYLKCEEIDFYETQSSFTMPLMEMTKGRVKYINATGYKVSHREETKKQIDQFHCMSLYLPKYYAKRLRPYPFNSLQNSAFKRFAPQIIPRKIHQIWIGGKPIEKIRKRLQDTLREVNEGFEMFLWKDQNLTSTNFPIMYNLIRRSQEFQKSSKRNYNAPIAALMRYELLYHHGGIYMDFKTEGRKSYAPFLKYQNFFTDCGYETYGKVNYVGNGVIGASIHNRYLYKVLTELIFQETFDYEVTDFPKITGGYVVRKSFTDEEMFTQVGFGFQLISPHPSHLPILCAIQKKFKPDQEVFDVTDIKGKRFKIGIPCTIYPQTYSIFYKPLAGSWQVKPKSQEAL